MKKINQFAQMIAQIKSKSEDKIPQGFYTSEQWAKKQGIHKHTASTKCNIFVREGLMEMKQFRVMNGSGLCSVKHYKIIK